MSRIAHAVPMTAYDHIARVLEEAGGKDGVISRADAKGLVEKLRNEGRGTEALAAENLFKMIDAQDQTPGGRVTGYDLNLSRSFVQGKMLENRDVNRNGFSQDEVARMSPTGRALVELGQVLALEGPKSRVGHAVPEKGLAHVAALLREANGGDGITSRADLKALSERLYKEGRGTEALAANAFFSYVDALSPKPGTRVTAQNIDDAVGLAQQELLREQDKNKNGYSAAEVSTFSPGAKAFLLLGQMIEAGIIR